MRKTVLMSFLCFLIFVPVCVRIYSLYILTDTISLYTVLGGFLYLFCAFFLVSISPRVLFWTSSISFIFHVLYYGLFWGYYKYFGIFLSKPLILQLFHDFDKDSLIHVASLYWWMLIVALTIISALLVVFYKIIKTKDIALPLNLTTKTLFVSSLLLLVSWTTLPYLSKEFAYSVYAKSPKQFVSTFGVTPYLVFSENFGERVIAGRSVYQRNEVSRFELRVSRGTKIESESGVHIGPYSIPDIRYVFVIQVESLDNAVIDLVIQGKHVTPFLHALKTRPNTVYFPSFLAHHYVGSADTDYSILSGLDPENTRLTYSLPLNELNSLPRELAKHNIPTFSFQGIRGDFFYYKRAHEELGIQTMFDRSAFFPKTQGWLVDDALFFKNIWRMIEPITNNYDRALLYCITMQSHNPFYSKSKPFYYESGRSTLEIDYFNSICEVDCALRDFFYELSLKDYADETAVIILGDHISQVVTSTYSCWGDWPRTFDNVPLFISLPGISGGIAETITSSVDLTPTIADIFAIPAHPDWFGNNVFKHEKSVSVHYKEGVVVTNKYIVYLNGKTELRPRSQETSISADHDAMSAFFAFSKKQFLSKKSYSVPSNWFRDYTVKKEESADPVN